MKVVLVTWRDPAFFRGGWVSREELDSWAASPAPLVKTVGLLYKSKKDYIVILQTLGESKIADAIQITREAIVSVQKIGKVNANSF